MLTKKKLFIVKLPLTFCGKLANKNLTKERFLGYSSLGFHLNTKTREQTKFKNSITNRVYFRTNKSLLVSANVNSNIVLLGNGLNLKLKKTYDFTFVSTFNRIYPNIKHGTRIFTLKKSETTPALTSNMSNLPEKNSKSFFLSCKESRLENLRSFYGCFYLGPFSGEQSLTVANALRRTLLSELKGIAITSVEIDGALHEYSSLVGVRDSVLDIVLNLKEIVLKTETPFKKAQLGYLQARGPGVVRACDLKLPSFIQCVDPNQYIATLSEDGVLNMKIKIQQGKNYVVQKASSMHSLFSSSFKQAPSRNLWLKKLKALKNTHDSSQSVFIDSSVLQKQFNHNSNAICIDAVFMPVKKVNYTIELDQEINQDYLTLSSKANFLLNDSESIRNAFGTLQQRSFNLGQQNQNNLNSLTRKTTDLPHRIIVEIWTNGSIHPREALYQAFRELTLMFSRLEKSRIINALSFSEMIKSDKLYKKLLEKIDYRYKQYRDLEMVLENQPNQEFLREKNLQLTKEDENKSTKMKNTTNLKDQPKQRIDQLQTKTNKLKPKQSNKNLNQKLLNPLNSNKFGQSLRSSVNKKFIQKKQQLRNSPQFEFKDIGNLDLSLRTYKCLKLAGVDTIDDLAQYSSRELLGIRNFGKKCLEEVKKALTELGQSLKDQ